jgi:hypothetical protein
MINVDEHWWKYGWMCMNVDGYRWNGCGWIYAWNLDEHKW